MNRKLWEIRKSSYKPVYLQILLSKVGSLTGLGQFDPDV